MKSRDSVKVPTQQSLAELIIAAPATRDVRYRYAALRPLKTTLANSFWQMPSPLSIVQSAIG